MYDAFWIYIQMHKYMYICIQIDRPPAAHRARRALYDKVNGRTLLFNFRAFTVLDNTDFSLLGSQASWLLLVAACFREQAMRLM